MPHGSIPHGQQRPDANNRHAKQQEQRQENQQQDGDDSYELALARKMRPALVAVPAVAMLDRKLDHEAFFVFSAICAYTNGDGRLWISHKTLAAIIHRSVADVEAAIERLQARGYLDSEVDPHE